jgi:Bifunctional DNA primase/polymerase, N-terminal
MTGIFTQFQPRYAEHWIATFPINPGKVAMMKYWGFVGLRASAELAKKFNGADAFAYRCGKRSNVTVLDVDSTDERVTEDAIRRHGQPTIVVRTASGKFHLLYRYNGERRRIRPWGKELPIDLLGEGKKQGGYAIGAPSKVATGQYEIVHGCLDDLDRLVPMVGIGPSDPAIACPSSSPLRGMREHDGRNHALFMAMAPIARKVHQASGSRDQLLAIASEHNVQCAEPMEDSEVNTIVSNLWNMTLEGRNVVGLPEAFCLTLDHLDIEDPYAFKLLAFLRANQGPAALFWCTNGLADRFGWDRHRLADARRTLIELGYLMPVRQAGRGHPALFRWGRY